MKKTILSFLFLFVSIVTFAGKPNWIENTPRHQSPNFECKVVYTRARTEKEAEDASQEKIFEMACKKAGVSLNSNNAAL